MLNRNSRALHIPVEIIFLAGLVSFYFIGKYISASVWRAIFVGSLGFVLGYVANNFANFSERGDRED